MHWSALCWTRIDQIASTIRWTYLFHIFPVCFLRYLCLFQNGREEFSSVHHSDWSNKNPGQVRSSVHQVPTASMLPISVWFPLIKFIVSYKIESSTNRAGFASGTVSVIRRYSDFAWLSSEISRQCPGIIVPPLPEKQSVGRFSSDFVESRRRALEKFLQRVSVHHEIGSLPQFIIFLQGDDAAFARAKGDAKSGKPSVTSSAMAWFEGTINTISNGKVVV